MKNVGHKWRMEKCSGKYRYLKEVLWVVINNNLNISSLSYCSKNETRYINNIYDKVIKSFFSWCLQDSVLTSCICFWH